MKHRRRQTLQRSQDTFLVFELLEELQRLQRLRCLFVSLCPGQARQAQQRRAGPVIVP
jgi:hypothetical protein